MPQQSLSERLLGQVENHSSLKSNFYLLVIIYLGIMGLRDAEQPKIEEEKKDPTSTGRKGTQR